MTKKRQLEQFALINRERQEAEEVSWREYRDALSDYNDALRTAYQVHHDRLDEIEREWQTKLQKIK